MAAGITWVRAGYIPYLDAIYQAIFWFLLSITYIIFIDFTSIGMYIII